MSAPLRFMAASAGPLALLLVGCLMASGCEREPAAGTPPDSAPGAPALPGDTVQVTVYFTRGEETVPVTRALARDSATLQDALEALLRGPTEEERAQGVTSWFSAETAGALTSVTLGDEGAVVVDLRDLRSVIPGASSSAGSAALLAELNATVFHFPWVRTVEYRMEGSCAAFWEWLQYGCQVVPRS